MQGRTIRLLLLASVSGIGTFEAVKERSSRQARPTEWPVSSLIPSPRARRRRLTVAQSSPRARRRRLTVAPSSPRARRRRHPVAPSSPRARRRRHRVAPSSPRARRRRLTVAPSSPRARRRRLTVARLLWSRASPVAHLLWSRAPPSFVYFGVARLLLSSAPQDRTAS